MRRRRQSLPADECLSMLQAASSGVLALAGDEGYPYAVPLSFASLPDGTVYFHSATEGHKIDALRHCDKASFCVIGQDEVVPDEFTTYFRSVVIFGRIAIVDNPTERIAALRLLAEKYAHGDEPGFRREIDKDAGRVCILRLTPEQITGKEAIELTAHRLHKT